MANHAKSKNTREIKNLSCAEAARLAGAIWIYGGIHIPSEKQPYPKIMITMPIPLVYQFEKDFGGRAYRGPDGYFTLQIARQLLVKKRLEEIQGFMGGEEAEQIRLALELIRTRNSELADEEKKKQIKELIEKWKESREKLRSWMKEFIESHKDENISKTTGIPKHLWRKAYEWAELMEESGYDFFPEMGKLSKNVTQD